MQVDNSGSRLLHIELEKEAFPGRVQAQNLVQCHLKGDKHSWGQNLRASLRGTYFPYMILIGGKMRLNNFAYWRFPSAFSHVYNLNMCAMQNVAMVDFKNMRIYK